MGDHHNVQPDSGELRIATKRPIIIRVLRYYVEHPWWGILSATLASFAIIVGYALGGIGGTLVSALMAVIGAYATTRHRVFVEEHHRS